MSARWGDRKVGRAHFSWYLGAITRPRVRVGGRDGGDYAWWSVELGDGKSDPFVSLFYEVHWHPLVAVLDRIADWQWGRSLKRQEKRKAAAAGLSVNPQPEDAT